MRTIQAVWTSDLQYGVLLHFVQILDEMLWHEARQIYRAPALDTYHLAIEAVKTHKEISEAGLSNIVLQPIFEELRNSISNDPVIKSFFLDASDQLEFHLKQNASFKQRVSAIAAFADVLTDAYIKRCRDYNNRGFRKIRLTTNQIYRAPPGHLPHIY
jgi:hypothetical protein